MPPHESLPPAVLDKPGPPAKPRRISAKVDRAITLMLDGTAKTQTEAAALAGMARETLCRALQQPHVQAEVQARVERQIKGMTLIRAAGRLDRLIDAASEHVQFKAAELSLALNGYQPPKQGVIVNNSVSVAGWVIDLRGDESSPGKPVIDSSAAGGVIIDLEPEEVDHGP